VAISVAWQTVVTVTTSATVYTTPAATATTFGYARDLVLTNSGTATIFIGMGVANVSTSVASFNIPAGGSLVLTQCQVPANTPISAIVGAGTTSVSVGYATNVNYF
jgi:hypothetical protein